MDTKDEITKKFSIPCEANGENLEFTWKQFSLNDNNVLLRELKKETDTRFDTVVVETDGTLVGKSVRPVADNGYYQCFVNNSKGTAFSRKLRLQITSKLCSDFRAVFI